MWVIVEGSVVVDQTSNRPIHNPRMIIAAEMTSKPSMMSYQFQANLLTLSSGLLPENDHEFYELLDTLHPFCGYAVCCGLPKDVCDELETIQSKNTRKWGLPFGRVDHYDCLLWFQPLRKAEVNRCCQCTKLLHYLQSEIKRRKRVTVEQKALRTLPSSHCPVKYLSPASFSKRVKLLQHEKQVLKKQVHCNCMAQ